MHMKNRFVSVMQRVDDACVRWIRSQWGHSPWRDRALVVVARYGAHLFFLGMGLLVIDSLLFVPRYASRAIVAVFVAVIAGLLSKMVIDALGEKYGRQRPFVRHHYAPLFAKDSGDPSFPSNHAGGACALATCVSLYVPAVQTAVWALAILVVYARLYTGVHYVSDVLAGALIGITVGVACVILLG